MTGPENPEELARMAKERNGLYSLLAAVFREKMSGGLLNQLLAPDFLSMMAEVGIDTSDLTDLVPDDDFQEDLFLEFSRLFFGPGKHASPYESVYRGAGGTLWGPETSAVKKFIEQAGFAYEEAFHGLPDHISVELEFMAHLTGLEADAWQAGDKDKAINCIHFQKEFMDRHLSTWVGAFANRVAELAEMPLYPQLATLICDFVEAENQELTTVPLSNDSIQ